MLQNLIHKFQNNLFLLPAQGGFYDIRYDEDRVFIGDTSLRKYTPRNRNNITCVCEACISAMLLQYYLNEWGLRELKCWKYTSQCHTN